MLSRQILLMLLPAVTRSHHRLFRPAVGRYRTLRHPRARQQPPLLPATQLPVKAFLTLHRT